MKFSHSYRLPVLIIFAIMAGCRGSGDPAGDQKEGHPYLRCAEIEQGNPVRKFEVPPLTLVEEDGDLKVNGIASSVITLGVLSGIQEADKQTNANLASFFEQFKAAQVQTIAVVGGIGKTRSQIDAVLDQLVKAPVPILLLPGAQENFSAFRAAIQERRKRHPRLIDMTKTRRVFLKQVALISLPGYYNPFYLESQGGGCSYDEPALEKLSSLVVSGKTNVLLSPSPPRGHSPVSTDRARGGINIGDPALWPAMKSANLSFGLFGHVYESAGHAISMEGEHPIKEGVWTGSLLLQVGAASAIPVPTVDGALLAGIAQVVSFSGKRARFKQILPVR